jgi:hypothetical protein
MPHAAHLLEQNDLCRGPVLLPFARWKHLLSKLFFAAALYRLLLLLWLVFRVSSRLLL